MTAPQPQQFPLRGSNKAPHWTWKGPEDNFTLSIFFDEVERTCRSIGKADDKDFIDAAILYTDPSARELWGRLPETRAATPDWTVFKTQCYSYYPKANKTDRYTSAHLRQVAEYLQKIPIQTLDDFGRYDRHIMTIGLDLLQRTTPLIHKAELNYFYSRGIHPALQMHIIQRLSLMHPNHQPGEPFDYELVQAAAKYILESQLSPYGNLPMMYPPQMYQYESPQMGIPASYPTWQMPAPAMPLQMYTDPTPQVHHAPPQPKLSMEEVIKALTDMDSGAYVNPYQTHSRYPMFPTQPPAPLQPSVAPQFSAPIPEVASPAAPPVVKQEVTMGDLLMAINRLVEGGVAGGANANRKCAYDACDKKWRDCDNRRADQDKGLIKYDSNTKRTVMPDETEIPRGAGIMRDRVFKWHADKNAPAQMSANLLTMKKQTQETYQIPEIKYPSSFPSFGTPQPVHTITPSHWLEIQFLWDL